MIKIRRALFLIAQAFCFEARAVCGELGLWIWVQDVVFSTWGFGSGCRVEGFLEVGV